MRIHIRFDSSNIIHTRFTIFINGGNCGQLCMRTNEACNFHQLLQMACSIAPEIDQFLSSGKVYSEEDKEEERNK